MDATICGMYRDNSNQLDIGHTLKNSDYDDEEFYISDVSKADGDTDSTFNFAQLELEFKDVIQDVKENVNETKEKDLQCKQFEYKCKRTRNT